MFKKVFTWNSEQKKENITVLKITTLTIVTTCQQINERAVIITMIVRTNEPRYQLYTKLQHRYNIEIAKIKIKKSIIQLLFQNSNNNS